MRTKTGKRWAVGLYVASAFGAAAHASSTDYGYIDSLLSSQNGAVMFNINANRTAAPSCQGSSIPKRFALDTSTVAGQAQAKVLMDAYTKRKRIAITGTGTCSLWGDTETSNIFQVEDKAALGAPAFISGHISTTFASGGGNMAFRVTLDSALPSSCAGNFAYVNKAFDNYQVYVANLMSAYYAGKSVSLTYGVDSAGYCQIVEYGTS